MPALKQPDIKWFNFSKYGVWVSDQGEILNARNERAIPHMVNNDLRVSVSHGGCSRSFSVKRLVADAFVEKPFIGNSGLIAFKNGDPYDCRAQNLVWRRREQRDRGAGEPGVSFNKETGRWKAYMVVNRKVIYVGYYRSKEHAVSACNKAYAMLADNIPIEQIRASLREKPVMPPVQSKPPKTKESWRDWPSVAGNERKESWLDWPSAKKIYAGDNG